MVTLQWSWDIKEISSIMDVTDNVAELMKAEILNSLNEDARWILQIGACLGASFDEDTLLLVATHLGESDALDKPSMDAKTTLKSLELCVKKGFVVSHEPDQTSSNAVRSYRFAHDVVQEAALSLIPEEEKLSELEMSIGKVLAANLSSSELDRHVFIAVDLLNRVEIDSLEDERRSLVELNLLAGRKAMSIVAFDAAARYFRKGIEFLGPHRWDVEYYSESFQLFNFSAQAEYCNGNGDVTIRLCQEALSQSNGTLEDNLPTHIILVEALSSQEKYSDALATSLALLRQLGMKLPSRASLKVLTLSELIKTKALLRGKTSEQLCALPNMHDEIKATAMKLMDHALNDCYILNSDYFAVLIFRMVRWSVKYGVCAHSPPAFSTYGLILASLGQLKEAHEYAKVGLSLSERSGFEISRSRVLMHSQGYTGHWTTPLNSGTKPLVKGYESGLSSGDNENAFFNIYFYLVFMTILGKPLVKVEEAFADFTRQMKQYNMLQSYTMTLPHWQFVLNMMGKSDDPIVLSGAAMDLEEMLKRLEDTNFAYALDVVRTLQLYLAFYFGKYELAWEMVEASTTNDKTNISQPTVWRRTFFVGLTSFSLARVQANKSRHWRRQAMIAYKRMKKWVSSGSVNCVHLLHLFQAEKFDLDGNFDEATAFYELAISTAARAGFVQDRALANERAADYYIRQGDAHWGSHHLSLAHQHYLEWGSFAKAKDVRCKMTSLIEGRRKERV